MVNPQPLKIAVDAEAVSAVLLCPPNAKALYLFAHGAGAGMDHHAMESNAQGLAARSIATLRYQFLYMEKGSRRPDGPKAAHAVVRAAAAKAAQLVPELPLLAGGRSFGGRMTSQTQAEEALPNVLGLAFLGFPLHPVDKPGIDRAAHLSKIAIPMIFIAGSRDALAETDLLCPVVSDLGNQSRLHIVDHADHSFKVAKKSGRTTADAEAEALDALAGWISNII